MWCFNGGILELLVDDDIDAEFVGLKNHVCGTFPDTTVDSYPSQSKDAVTSVNIFYIPSINWTKDPRKKKFVAWLKLMTQKNNFNPLSVNFTKWSSTLKQFVGKFPTNCLSVFDHFVGLALKGLNWWRVCYWTTRVKIVELTHIIPKLQNESNLMSCGIWPSFSVIKKSFTEKSFTQFHREKKSSNTAFLGGLHL